MPEQHPVYLSLGSNVGERENNLGRALTALINMGLVAVKFSSVYETAPVNMTDQPRFLNMVALMTTIYPPDGLLRLIKTIEQDIGREATVPKGPRVIDIDILLYDMCTIDTAGLTIPHKEIRKRAFVLVPLIEVDPDAMFPDGELVRRSLTGLELNDDVIKKVGELTLK